MKKLLLIVAGVAILALPMTSIAGVAGSDHDFGGQKLCEACHTPHNASGARLWAATPSGTFSGVQDLCYTCHDGSVTSVGLTTVFDALKEQHLNVGPDCSGDGACHDVHNQTPNLTGKFLVVGETGGNYCESCHGTGANSFNAATDALGDHTAGITHFTNGGSFTCNQCHTPHGATAQTAPIGLLTNPILLDDNNGAYYGSFCISCHNGTAPAVAVTGSGGQAATDVFDYAEAVSGGTETKHPTITTGGSFPVGGCNKCHDVHDPDLTATGYLLTTDNANSGFCVSCHDGASGPGVGGNSHPLGVPTDVNLNNGLTPALPWANQIDDDGVVGADWSAGVVANAMVCETCHSVHRNGNTGPDAQYFLRHENGDTNQLCTACHSAN